MWIILSAKHKGVDYPVERYLYYSRKEAERRYREKYGLVRKRGVVFFSH